MNDLFKINYDADRITLSARDLHQFLESKERFSKWYERMVSYGFVENIDYRGVQKSTEVPNNGGLQTMELKDYQITIDMAKEIAMLQRNEKGKIARQYFIDIEKKWNSPEFIINRALEFSKRQIEKLTIENKELTNEVIYKEDVIVGLVEDIDLTEKRRRITQIVRHGSRKYQERYNLLYKEFEMKYHMDLNRRMESDAAKSIVPKIKNKMDYIDRGLHKIPELYEVACKLFENDVKKLQEEIWDVSYRSNSESLENNIDNREAC